MLDLLLIVKAIALSDYHEWDLVIKAVDGEKSNFLDHTQMQIKSLNWGS